MKRRMDKKSRRLKDLSPEKRALLEKLLKKKSQAKREAARIRPRPNQEEYPLSYAQQRMWFLFTLEPDSPAYNIPAAVRLQGPLDVGALEGALNSIIARHEVLRARYRTGPEGPEQEILPQLRLSIPLEDLSDLEGEPQQQAVRERIRAEVDKPFDIEREPVIRARLLRLAPDDHILVLVIHHIAFDEWSTQVFMREFGAIYEALVAGREPNLPPLPIQYADYAWWQRQELSGEKLETQIDYWRRQLAGAPSLITLPTDHPRPPIQTYHGDAHHFTLPRELWERLHRLADEEGASLFMALMAAYQVLLRAYAHQDDILVGTPILNRNRKELEDLIGFFTNTLVIRGELDGRMTFREFLRQIRQTALDAYAHQDVPFEMLVDELQPHRNLSYTPFFQTVLTLQKADLQHFRLRDLTLSLLHTGDVSAKFDLSVIVLEGEDEIHGVMEYNTDLFEGETIARMARHFLVLLDQLVANPDLPLSQISMLTPEERRMLLVDWNATQRDYPRDATIPQLFAHQAAATPDTPAVVFEGETLTYAELDARANQLAHALIARGVGPESRVGVLMERSGDVAIAVMGILKAGAAYVPLDPSYPAERLRYMIEDAGVEVVIRDQRSEVRGQKSEDGSQTLDIGHWTLDDFTHYALRITSDQVQSQPTTNPNVAIYPANAAYVIYTSGSTGRPKGVVVPHRGVINILTEFHRRRAVQPGERSSWWTSLNFDVSVWEIFLPLLFGGTLVVPREEVRIDTPRFLAWMEEQGIESAYLPPFMVQPLLAFLQEGRRLPLRRLLVGVEPIPEDALIAINRLLPELQIINGYGPTEATICCTLYEIDPGQEYHRNTPIGKPYQNVQIYLLDEHMQPVPVGVPGEVYIGGDGLARGYLDRPALTAERFVPDPFVAFGNHEGTKARRHEEGKSEEIRENPMHPRHPRRIETPATGQRLYRTGDLARWLPDGNLMFLGRVDFQVKVRGFRIELGEIESQLREHPGVQDVLVWVWDDPEMGEKRLTAYLIPRDDARPTIAELRRFLADRLPDYMIPAAFIFLDAFPLTPSGKINRRALPPPDFTALKSEQPYVAPRTPLEEHLARRFAEALGVEKVGIHDDFFELGGDSLRGAVLINRLQDDFQNKAPVRAIFLAPTVAKMATYLQEYFPDAVRRFFTADIQVEARYEFEDEIARPGQGVDAAKLRQFRAIIPHLPRRLEDERLPKNPPAVFILSPPRSGSTLLRVMLAGHPRLFAPPELDLLSFNTLGQRRAAFRGRFEFWLEGLIRAVMELRGVDADEARAMLAEYERQDMSVKAFYGLLQSWLGDRILVDKTPVYALDPAILQRMEWDFENARFIHLTRHPYATIYSFIEAKLDEVFFRWEHPFTRRELAELIWIAAHENIREFLDRIPPQRQMRLRYEDLLADPEAHMRALSDFLGVDFVPAMLDPYSEDRMTTGLEPGKQMVGDYKFYLRKRIDPAAATRWKRFHRHDFLSDIARDLAREFGYDDFAPASSRPLARSRIPQIPRTPDLPLSFAQQRLWFIDHLEPGAPLYNLPSAVRMQGPLHIEALEAAFNDIVQRHEVLRTTFHTVDGRPQQIIHPAMPIRIRLEDLRGLPEEARWSEAQRRAQRFAQQPFDLSRGPLLRVTLYRLADDDHLAVIVMHHIISDGWSIGILHRELAHCYQARIEGRSPDLPPLPIQYADFAAWQRQWLESEEAQAQIAFWKKTLAPHPTFLKLPTDRPRPPVQTYHGAQIRFDLNAGLIAQLDALARSHGATLFMALLAGFHALLHRYAGQDSINVGVPHANRSLAEIENLIGFFVNTLVIRADFSDDPTFDELLARIQAATVEAYAHQDAPFELVVDAVQPDRDPSYSPLFQVMFAYQEDPPAGYRLPDFILAPVHLDMGIAKFDLTLSAVRRKGDVRAVLEYNTDLFDEATIRRFVGHYRRLIEEAVAQPDQRVSAIAMLTPEERRMLLVEWNATQRDYPRDATIPQLFARQAAATPDTPAVVFEGQTLTYAELDARANQLAHALIARGVGPESRVGVLMERSGEVAVAVMGILKAGAAYVPLDPSYPPERLRYMIEDAGVEVVINDQRSEVRSQRSEVRGQKSEDGSQTLDIGHWTLDDFTHYALRITSDQVQSQPTTNPNVAIYPANAAYVIYTSGSTGRPKGVVVPHRGVINILTEFHRRRAVQPGERSSWWTSLNFDVSVWEIFLPLLFGGTLVVPREEVRIDTPRFLAWMEEQGIESAYLPPFMVQPLLAFLQEGRRLPLRRLLVGVEPIPEDALIAINRLLPELQIINGYGPTEATICCTLYEIDPGQEYHRNTPIGKPYQNVQIYLLDEHMQPVPVGVPGEVYIGGDGLARGYLDRPALTAERFVPDPFVAFGNHEGTKARRHEEGKSEEIRENPMHPRHPRRIETPATGQRLYRTGDLARWLPDGNLMFLGRVDFQVKVRGFRIELGEIERVMETHEAIDEAVAIVREDAPGVKRIVGYFTWTGAAPPEARELRAFLAETLPEYMIPSAFVPLDAFPRTPNDKIDRKALPKPVYHRPEEGVAFRAPVTQVEATLARIWQEVLGLETVGVDDNFFELGGDSILAIQMISRAADEGILITAKQLFQYPTIAGLAAVAETGEAVHAEQGEVTGEAPLTPIQRWFFEQNFPHPEHWNQAILLDVGQPLDPDLLAEAVAALVRHHDALRLRFRRDEDGGWVQVNGDADTDEHGWTRIFETIELAETPDEALAGAITDHCARIQGSLNLAEGPLFRAAYFDLGGNRGWRLFLVAHHLIIDGVSWRILTEDLQRAYMQLAAGQPVSLPRKTTAFIHWARALADYAREADRADDLAFWREMLARPVAPLPVDRNAPNLERDLALFEIRIPTDAHPEEDIRSLLLTAFAQTLAAWTGSDQVRIAMEGHGRDLDLPGVDVSRTVGWFTTLYPLTLDLASADGGRDAVARVRERAEAAAQRAASYGILRHLRGETGLAMDAQVSFNYLGRFEGGRGGFSPAAESNGPERHPDNHRPFLIDFSASLIDDELRITWAYNAACHRPETIQRLADAFRQHFQALLELPADESLEDDLLDEILDEIEL